MIAVPPFLIGAGLLFWGWQSGNWITAAVLAVMLEAGRRVRIRFDLGAAEHSRIADLCTILFVGLTVVLAVNRGVAHGILAAFQWLPAALAPILLAQMLSESGRVPLSALFRHMRKLKRDNPSIKDPLIDTSAVYLALVLISAGVANARGPGYYIGVVLAAAWGLFMWRPLHASAAAWVLMLGAGAAGGYAGHAGLAHLQAQLEAWIADWQLGGFDGDPSRSTTDIGSIGKLKLRDALVLRVYVPPAEVKRVRLLHRSSYNTYVGTTWLTRGAPMETVTPEEGGLSWPLAAAQPEWSARMAARVERGRILLSLPSATTRITGLGATAVRRNALGSVQAELAGDWIRYEAEAAASSDTSAPPRREDLAVSAAERATFDGLAAELGLNGLGAGSAAPRAGAFRRLLLFDVARGAGARRRHAAGRFRPQHAIRPLRVFRRRDDAAAARCGHSGALCDRFCGHGVQPARGGVHRARAPRARLGAGVDRYTLDRSRYHAAILVRGGKAACALLGKARGLCALGRVPLVAAR